MRFRAALVHYNLSTYVRTSPAEVIAKVGSWCAENQATTGWTNSRTGARVANGPFPHHKRRASRREEPRAPPTAKRDQAPQPTPFTDN